MFIPTEQSMPLDQVLVAFLNSNLFPPEIQGGIETGGEKGTRHRQRRTWEEDVKFGEGWRKVESERVRENEEEEESRKKQNKAFHLREW